MSETSAEEESGKERREHKHTAYEHNAQLTIYLSAILSEDKSMSANSSSFADNTARVRSGHRDAPKLLRVGRPNALAD